MNVKLNHTSQKAFVDPVDRALLAAFPFTRSPPAHLHSFNYHN